MARPAVDIFSAGVLAAAVASGAPPAPGPELERQGGRSVQPRVVRPFSHAPVDSYTESWVKCVQGGARVTCASPAG